MFTGIDLDFAFFDSWGGLWLSCPGCPANTPGVEAFGPLAVARPVSADEAAAAGLPSVHASDFPERCEGEDGWLRPYPLTTPAEPRAARRSRWADWTFAEAR